MAEKIDILFINPGDRQQTYQELGDEFCAIETPVFAGLFASYVRNKGASAGLIDGPAIGMSATMIAAESIADYDPTLIVIVVYGLQPSASTQNMPSAGAIARLIKDGKPGAKIMMTGTHPSALPERTMREEAVDFVCDGEGPVTILQTWQALKAGIEDFSDIPDLWWRGENGIVPSRSRAPLLTNLDREMPGVAWDLMNMGNYRSHNWHAFDHIHDRSYASIHTSLGCPYKCSFCCINAPFGKPSYRMWSPKTVVKEIDYLVETHGIKNIKIVDEMFVLNKRHVHGVCDLLIERDYDVNIWAYARVDSIKDEFLDKLKAAGINWICLGIESASEYVRDGADKAYGTDDLKEVIHRVQGAGLYVMGNYIFGLPDDTPERMRETLDLSLDLNCEFSNYYSAMAYPGSQLYTEAVTKGLTLPDHWGQFSQHSYDSMPLANSHCTSDEILKFRDEAWNIFFTSERYQNMIGEKFGHNVVEHVRRMTAIPLKRKYMEVRS